MSKVYFTSDLHLGHDNLCVNLRGMTSEESNNIIIKNWNNIVTKKDTVYILGDVVMEKTNNLHLLNQLNGNIIVIGGNHDNKKVCIELNNMNIPVIGCLVYKGFICTHVPVHPSELEKTFIGNIHGHIHLPGIFKTDELGNEINWEYKPELQLGAKYINVNIEFNNYTPVLFDDIVDILTKRILIKT